MSELPITWLLVPLVWVSLLLLNNANYYNSFIYKLCSLVGYLEMDSFILELNFGRLRGLECMFVLELGMHVDVFYMVLSYKEMARLYLID